MNRTAANPQRPSRLEARMQTLRNGSFWIHGIGRLFLYLCLCCIAYVFLFPFLFMIVTALKSPEDLVDITIQWIPSGLYWQNFAIAWKELVYPRYFFNSLVVTVLSTVGHVVSCSLVAYGFARYRSRLLDVLFLVVIFTMIVPIQVIIVPLFMMYSNFGWLNSYFPMIVPTFFGFGLRGGLFIFIFRQIFLGMPKELEEAAFIDGCGRLHTYGRIALPVAQPAILVSVILSVVWHWNDYVEPGYYIISQSKKLLPAMLPNMYRMAQGIGGGAGENVGEFVFTKGMAMAGTFLVLLPVLLFYILLQRKFMTSIERTGLVG